MQMAYGVILSKMCPLIKKITYYYTIGTISIYFYLIKI